MQIIVLNVLCSCVGGILVSVLTSSVVDHETNIGVVKPDNEVGICCFSAKHSVIRRKNKDLFAPNQNNVFPSGATSLHLDCCFSGLEL